MERYELEGLHLDLDGSRLTIRFRNRVASILLTGGLRQQVLLDPTVVERVTAKAAGLAPDNVVIPAEIHIHGTNGWTYRMPYRERHLDHARALMDALRLAGFNVET